MAYEFIAVEAERGVGVIRLDRPSAMNALCDQLTREMADALIAYEQDETIGCVVLAGSSKAFAAGADVNEISERGYLDMYEQDPFAQSWESVARFRKPIIAAVAGYALGGGCEIALMCDFIIAGENAKFGQPEITLGIMPGAGGTQRLARFAGKAKAMDLCLTGRTMDAPEAERAGLVSRIVPVDDLMDEAMNAAARIASMSRPIAMMTKEAVNAAYETTLAQGIMVERRLFQAMFTTEDQKEGMAAFVEKRSPHFKNR